MYLACGATRLLPAYGRRLDQDPGDSLRFAAGLASLKMEKARPFDGTLAEVLERMNTKAAL
jgi:hypothetical protein